MQIKQKNFLVNKEDDSNIYLTKIKIDVEGRNVRFKNYPYPNHGLFLFFKLINYFCSDRYGLRLNFYV